ncbi:hypothetical protein TIFTF001_012129 [Ficus carica]|uniref:Orn/DAP/Arg decarboxylase 2 N-terminal domain-containing protein n=1 Tax=Ficus carica TaxID=3494 RepID=A0AA87ZVF6_FICCA|nr:hypothetical protein TIFTF001_012129 [Ficus carica]
MARWTNALPTIRPFYVVKCNPDPVMLAALASLGSSFDCASRAELESVLSLALGVSPDRIIFANPCKLESHIEYAATVGVSVTTFDSVAEDPEDIDKIFRSCAVL